MPMTSAAVAGMPVPAAAHCWPASISWRCTRWQERRASQVRAGVSSTGILPRMAAKGEMLDLVRSVGSDGAGPRVSEEVVVVNKSEVVQDVAGASGMSKPDVERVIDAFFDTVRVAVGNDDKVGWPSFAPLRHPPPGSHGAEPPHWGTGGKGAASTARSSPPAPCRRLPSTGPRHRPPSGRPRRGPRPRRRRRPPPRRQHRRPRRRLLGQGSAGGQEGSAGGQEGSTAGQEGGSGQEGPGQEGAGQEGAGCEEGHQEEVAGLRRPWVYNLESSLNPLARGHAGMGPGLGGT